MPKGNRGGKSGGGVRSVVAQNGETIDLSDNPLVYGANDASISEAARSQLEEFA